MNKTTKMGVAVLLASAISLSATPMAFAGGAGCAVGGAIGALAGSFIGGKGKLIGQIAGGAVGCGAGHMIQNQQKKPNEPARKAGSHQNNSNSSARSNTTKQRAVASTPAKPRVVADPLVQSAQASLLALGYTQVGTPDGFAGKNTASAVMAFQKDQGIPETGVLDAGMMAFISREAGGLSEDSVTDVASLEIEGSDVQGIVTPSQNVTVDVPEEMTQEEYLQAEREAGPIMDNDTVLIEEPVKQVVDQPVEVVLAPQQEKPVQKAAPDAPKLTNEF